MPTFGFWVISTSRIAPEMPLRPKPHPFPALTVTSLVNSATWELKLRGGTMQSLAHAAPERLNQMPAQANKTCFDLFTEVSRKMTAGFDDETLDAVLIGAPGHSC